MNENNLVHHRATTVHGDTDEDVMEGRHYHYNSDQPADGENSGATFSIEEAVEAAGFGWFQIRILIVCGILSAADAMEMLLLSVLGPALRCEWNLESGQIAFITTIVFVGYLCGAPLWGKISDKYGRWTSFFLVLCIIGYFGLMTAFSPNITWIIILRGLVGFGIGGMSSSFTLLSEFLPARYRAKVLIAFQICWAVGSTFEIALAYMVLPTLGWRYLVALSSLPMFFFIVAVFFLPESPRFLLTAGEREKALRIITIMFRDNRKPMLPGTLISSNVAVESRGNFRDLFSSQYRRTTLMSLVLWFGIAFSYYGIILVSAEIFRFHSKCYAAVTSHTTPLGVNETFVDTSCCVGITADDYKAMLVSSFGEYVVIPLNMYLVDSIGRRRTMGTGFFLTGVFFGLLCLCVPKAVTTGFLFVVRAFASGIFNTLYVYTSEVYPTTVRALGIGFCSAFARFGSMSTPFVAQVIMPDVSLVMALMIYVGVDLLCAIICVLLPIETLGRPLPQTVITYSTSKPDDISSEVR